MLENNVMLWDLNEIDIEFYELGFKFLYLWFCDF